MRWYRAFTFERIENRAETAEDGELRLLSALSPSRFGHALYGGKTSVRSTVTYAVRMHLMSLLMRAAVGPIGISLYDSSTGSVPGAIVTAARKPKAI
jgi:hypothetical protein